MTRGITDWLKSNAGIDFEGYISGQVYKDKNDDEYLFSHVNYRGEKEAVFSYYYNLTNPIWASGSKRCLERLAVEGWVGKVEKL